MTTGKNITEYIDLIDSRETFLDFLSLLQEDFLDNKEDWENQTIYTYLNGMIGFTTDIEGYCKFQNIGLNDLSSNPWKLFTRILLASRVYE